MIVVVTLEHRFGRTPDGAVWTPAGFTYPFWLRYLDVFDHVHVVARVQDAPSPMSSWRRADGEGISFVAVPYYIGPWQYLRRARQVRNTTRRSVGPQDAVILRVGSQIASLIEDQLHSNAHPYGVEVVVDPYDVFAPGSVRHPLRAVFRWWSPRRLRQICARASACAYVTERALQRRYPPSSGVFATHYSDVELPEPAFVPAPRATVRSGTLITLISVGSLAQLYKAPDITLDATARCIRQGLGLRLVFVGDGKHRPELEARVNHLELGKHVSFLGQVPAGGAVRAQLDQADVFVLPSRTEGLPRAMIEAMARGLPCIGSTVGGIPELLSPEDMVSAGDVSALARKIYEVVTDPGRMVRMSARNLEKAREYHEDILREKRNAFYRHVREKTEAWLKDTGV